MLDDHYNFTIATHNNPQHAPLLKGKKAEAPSLPDDTRLPAIAPCSLIDHPFVHPFKKKEWKSVSFIEKDVGSKFVISSRVQTRYKEKMKIYKKFEEEL